jgi:hypothetical protein
MPPTLEDRVRGDLIRALGPGPSDPAAWTDVEPAARRTLRRRQRRRGGLLAVSVVVVVALAVGAVALMRSDHARVDTGPVDHGRSAPTTTPTRPRPRITAVPLTGGETSALVATPDGAWIGLVSKGVVAHVDPAGKIVAEVTIPGAQSSSLALAYGEDALWAIPYGGPVYRIDPRAARITGSVAMPNHGATGPAAAGPAEAERVAAGEGHVWVTACCDAGVTAPNQRLVRINPETLAIEGETAMPGQGESQRVAVGPRAVFVSGERFDSIVQVDPADGRIVREIPVGGPSAAVAVGADDIWAVVPPADPYGRRSGELLQIDGSGQLARRVALPDPGEQVATAASGGAWVLLFDGDIVFAGGTAPFVDVPDANAQFMASSGDVLWYVSGSTLFEARA